MLPDDPRHGTYAGSIEHYVTKTPTCDPCKAAAAEYRRKRRARMYLLRTDSLEVPAIGTLRRLQALAAIGHRLQDLDREMGLARGCSSWFLRNTRDVVHRKTADRVAELYERLSMTVPDYPLAERARKTAAKKGWAPPLAWDNIDDPNERPKFGIDKGRKSYIDHAAVERRLSGDRSVRLTPEEAGEVCRRAYRAGRSTNWIEEMTGLKAERYFKVGEDAA